MSITRRHFTQQLALTPYLICGDDWLDLKGSQKPKKLRQGDSVGLISPSSAVFNDEPTDIAIEALENFGFTVKSSPFLRSRHGHLAGTDKERTLEINQMFEDPDIKAVVCLRGGSGATRLLEGIDYSNIKKNPKVFIGYSDITALQLAIYKKTGLTTFHGPVGLSSWDSFSRHYFAKLLFDNQLVEFKNPPKREDEWVQTKK